MASTKRVLYASMRIGDDETIREVALKGWAGLLQETINTWVLSMPTRLKACIDSDGQLTAY